MIDSGNDCGKAVPPFFAVSPNLPLLQPVGASLHWACQPPPQLLDAIALVLCLTRTLLHCLATCPAAGTRACTAGSSRTCQSTRQPSLLAAARCGHVAVVGCWLDAGQALHSSREGCWLASVGWRLALETVHEQAGSHLAHATGPLRAALQIVATGRRKFFYLVDVESQVRREAGPIQIGLGKLGWAQRSDMLLWIRAVRCICLQEIRRSRCDMGSAALERHAGNRRQRCCMHFSNHPSPFLLLLPTTRRLTGSPHCACGGTRRALRALSPASRARSPVSTFKCRLSSGQQCGQLCDRQRRARVAGLRLLRLMLSPSS